MKLNSPKIGTGYDDYKKQICIADMHTLKMENRPAATERAQAV
ncbi:hypothetical protein CEV32_3577 [Brucella rhizosphaerae]|uniref:Uncharacterized protein n=1 Tax=Brucella rhizosphaerae TaxID=571254 RepID=A0A256FSV3_9HYPH|nr:hypothetical protein CEV32_3577 [Brucella rhizosphaerae]